MSNEEIVDFEPLGHPNIEEVLPPNSHLEPCGRNLQTTGCDPRGKKESSVVT